MTDTESKGEAYDRPSPLRQAQKAPKSKENSSAGCREAIRKRD